MSPIFIFHFSVIISSFSNIQLIDKIGKVDFKTYNYIVPQYIAQATDIWCISCTLMTIGFYLVANKSFSPIQYIIKNKKNIDYLFYILMVSNILSVIGSGVNYRGGLVFKLFGLLNTIGILFFARLWGKGDDKKFRTYALALFVIETYIALTTSYLRTELILPTVYLFVGYFIGKQDLKYLFSYRVIPGLLLIGFFSINFSNLKDNRSSFIDAFKGSKAEAEVDNQSSSALLDRSANLAQITNVVKLVKQNGFYNGKASQPLVAALIPRFLWPEKPKIALGTWFAYEIGVAYKSDEGRINNSVNMTVPGELYLDFGWVAVIFGSLILGAFIAVLWNATMFYSSEYNLNGIIFGGYLLFVGLLSFGADLQIVLTLISVYLAFLTIRKIAMSL